MKELMLLRHAKAVSEYAGGDFARPLAARGSAQVYRIANTFQAQAWTPELTFVSPAVRTLQTAQILEEKMGSLHILRDRTLYLATSQALLETLASAPQAVARLMLIGHNPGISDLASRLTARCDAQPLPTAGFMRCNLDITHWQQIRQWQD